MQPGGSGGAIATTPFSPSRDFLAGGFVQRASRRSRTPGTPASRTCAASSRRRDARTGSASRSRSASSCRSTGAPSASADPACVGSSSGSPARNRCLQRRQVVLLQVTPGPASSARGSRSARGTSPSTLYSSHDLPPDAGVGPDRQALVHDRRHAGDQRRRRRCSEWPTTQPMSRGGEHGLAGLAAEDVLHRRRRAPPRSRRCRAARPSAGRWCRRCRGCSDGSLDSSQAHGTSAPRVLLRAARVSRRRGPARTAWRASRPRLTSSTLLRRVLARA